MKIKSVWDFVEAFYPNYYSSDEIARNDDLQKLSDEEHQDGDDADKLLDKEYEGDINNGWIEIDLTESNAKIFKKAIEGYIEELNS